MKNDRIEIPITIETIYEYTNADSNEVAREQIEHAQLYLQSVFNFIKHSAMNLEGEFAHSENQAVSGFCYDLTNFCEIGNALASSIWKNVSAMNFKESETSAEIETSAETIDNGDADPDPILEHTAHPQTLAAVIPALLTNPNVPPQISDALADGVNEVMNASKQTEVLEYEQSAEYIAKVLRDYRSND